MASVPPALAPAPGGPQKAERDVSIMGAEGPHASLINGIYYSQPTSPEDEPLVYRKRQNDSVWLFRSKDGAWLVGPTTAAAVSWASSGGASELWARSAASEEGGGEGRKPLPPTQVGGWEVLGGAGTWETQQLLVVKGRLELHKLMGSVPLHAAPYPLPEEPPKGQQGVAPARVEGRPPRSPRTRTQTFDFDVLDAKEEAEREGGAAARQGTTFDFDFLDELEQVEGGTQCSSEDQRLVGAWFVEGRKPSVYDIARTEDGGLEFEQRMGASMSRLHGTFRPQPPWLVAELACEDRAVGAVRLRFLESKGCILSNFKPNGLDWGQDTYASRLPEPFLVDNRQLHAQTMGVGYRDSKRQDSKSSDSASATWGSVVMGVDEGDGWLQVSGRFLPMMVGGVQVLVPMELTYCCQPPNGQPLPIYAEPRFEGLKTGKALNPGTIFRVSLELKSNARITLLRLASGEGWVPAWDPNFGTVCFRHTAAPREQRSEDGQRFEGYMHFGPVGDTDLPAVQALAAVGPAPGSFTAWDAAGHPLSKTSGEAQALLQAQATMRAMQAMSYSVEDAQPNGQNAAAEGAPAQAEGEDSGRPAPKPAAPQPDFFPFRDDGAMGDEGWERDNVCRAVSLLYCEWILGRTPAPRSMGGRRFINLTLHEVDPLPTARNFYAGVFRPFYLPDSLDNDVPRPKGPDTPWLQRVYEATDPDCVREEFVQTADLPAIKIRQVIDCPKTQAWHEYFEEKGPVGAELLARDRSGCFCLSYFQLSVQGRTSASGHTQLDGRAHCIAVITKSLPGGCVYVCDPDVGIYRFKEMKDLLHFLAVTLKEKATRAPSGGVTGVSRLRLVEVTPAYWMATGT
mmetsp:Transcript_105125/g.329123  ORF Transcript_105125/g.329123 Transcript_105125/m.329123 type:complete len:851 (-) Transcript_105125:4-2556(-)